MSKVTYQVKEFSILVRGRCKPLGSLNSFLSSAPQRSGANPVSWLTLRDGGCAVGCFLPSPAPKQLPWRVEASEGSQLGEPSFMFGGQKSLMAVTFLAY